MSWLRLTTTNMQFQRRYTVCIMYTMTTNMHFKGQYTCQVSQHSELSLYYQESGFHTDIYSSEDLRCYFKESSCGCVAQATDFRRWSVVNFLRTLLPCVKVGWICREHWGSPCVKQEEEEVVSAKVVNLLWGSQHSILKRSHVPPMTLPSTGP